MAKHKKDKNNSRRRNRHDHQFDTIIIGGGIVGLSTAYALTQEGQKVLVLEAGKPMHDLGSSHGRSRITRLVNPEDEGYTAMVRYGYSIIPELEGSDKESIFKSMDGLTIGRQGSPGITTIKRIAEVEGVAHEMIDRTEIKDRYGINVRRNYVGMVEKEGVGTLNPHEMIARILLKVTGKESRVHFDEKVEGWNSTSEKVHVKTSRGSYRADKLVLTPGARTPKVLLMGQSNMAYGHNKTLRHAFKAQRIPLVFFMHPSREIPMTRWLASDGHGRLYTLPETQNGVTFLKAGFHHRGQNVDPERINREVSEREFEMAWKVVSRRLGIDNLRASHASVCMYTMTRRTPGSIRPIAVPLIGYLPNEDKVVIAAGFNGNGAKLALGAGRMVADMVLGRETEVSVENYSPGRFVRRHIRHITQRPGMEEGRGVRDPFPPRDDSQGIGR